MNIKEIELALSLPNDLLRLKIVILDNLLELFLFRFVREYAFDEWYRIDGDSTPENRIILFRSFYDKLKYCINKEILDEKTSLFLQAFHELRNQAYHQAFDNVTAAASSSSYDERNRLSYHAEMKKVFGRLTKLYAIVILELFEQSSEEGYLRQFAPFIDTNQHLKNDISRVLKENLAFRIKKIKDDLAYIEDYSDEYNNEEDFHEYQDMINHISFNYGYEIIEKSSLEHKTKRRFLELLHESPDYIDIGNIDSKNWLFSTNEIIEWENNLKIFDTLSSYLLAVNTWHTINRKLIILEEIIEYHIFIAC